MTRQSCFGQILIKYSAKDKLIFDNEISKYKLTDGDTLVDIGAGDGYNDELIFKFYPNMYFLLEDNKVKFLKGSNYYFKEGSQKYYFRDHYQMVLGNSDSIPLVSGQYRNILCRITLHEFSNPTKMLQEINRIMAINGQLIIVERIPKFEGQIDKTCKKKLLTQTEIVNMLATSGFKLISTDSTKYQNNKFGGNAYILRFRK